MLVARKEDGLTVDALAGRRAAWVDPLSVGGHLLVIAMLRRRRLGVRTLFAEQRFHGSYRHAMAAVVTGEADVAAALTPGFDEHLYRAELAGLVGNAQHRLVAIAFTDASPNDAVVLTRKLSAGAAARIAARLFPGRDRVEVPSFLLDALDADGAETAEPAEYEPLIDLLPG